MKYLLITITAVLLVGCGPSVPDISIHSAAKKGNIEAVKQHLAAGTDVNTKDKIDFSPLHYAAYRGNKEVVELLIAEGANVNAQDKIGMTLLHGAVYRGNKEVVEPLIANGADVNAKDDVGRTPLDYAMSVRDSVTADFLRAPEITDLLRKHGGKTSEELDAAGN